MNKPIKQRLIDQKVSKAEKSLSRRFVLASKTEIKAWKAFVTLMFVAGFFSALVWSAMNSWYVGSGAKEKKSAAKEISSSDKKDLAAYWSFDEDDNKTAHDKSPNKNDGTMFDIKKVQGKSKEAFAFNGASAYVKVPHSPSLDVTGELTLEAWIFPEEDKNQGAYLDGIVTKGALWDKNASYQLYFNPRSSKLNGIIRWGSGKMDFERVAKKLEMNKWSHVALTLAEKGHLELGLWVDGIKVASKKLPDGKKMQSSNLDVNIGGAYPNKYETRYFHGKIDEVRIYKQALLESELKKHAGIEPLKLKKLVHFGNMIESDETGEEEKLSFAVLGKNAGVLDKIAKSPFDGYAVKVAEGKKNICTEAPSWEGISEGVKRAKEFKQKTGKELWPTVNWSALVPCVSGQAKQCSEDLCDCEGGKCRNGKCTANGGACQFANAINPWDEETTDKFITLHKRAFQAAKEIGVEGVIIDPEFYGNHLNYTTEQIQAGMGERGNPKTPEEIEKKFKEIGARLADEIGEAYGGSQKVTLWMLFADLGNKGESFPTKYDKVSDIITEGVLKKARDKVRVIDGGEHLLRYIHSSDEEMNCAIKERNKKMKKALDKFGSSLSLGGTIGLYLDHNKVEDVWKTKIKAACKNEKSCGIKQECPEVKTVNDAVPLLQKLFSTYEYVWVYRGHGIPPFGETDPGMSVEDREKFRGAVVAARGTCGNSACEDHKGENKDNCAVDCAKGEEKESESADDSL